MSRRMFFLLAAVLGAALFACSRRRPLPPGFVLYAPPGAGYSFGAPGDWRALQGESGSLVTFYGPPGGAHPNAASIAVLRYSPAQFSGMDDYYKRETASASSATPLQEKKLPRGEARFFSMESQRPGAGGARPEQVTEEDYLVPSEDGFFALVYMCDSQEVSESEPVFQALVQTFHARGS